jgi:two-component system C4-dicarboxylate transport sensor histidine kinase DctB
MDVAAQGMSGRQAALRIVLGIFACLLIGWASYRAVLPLNLDREQRANAQRLGFYSASLESLLAKHEYLPQLISLERDVVAALAHPDDAARAAAANLYLETVQDRTGLAAVYIMDRRGRTLASSNWRTPQSFVGQNYAFRPYFSEAAAGRVGRFYAVGATTGEPGYFLAAPVRKESRIVGVAAIKVSLDEFEEALTRSGEHLLVTDKAGVVFLSAYKHWKYRTLAPLTEETRRYLNEARQYGIASLEPIAPGIALQPADATQVMKLPLPPAGASADRVQLREYMTQSRVAGPNGWYIVLFADTVEARRSALGLGAATGFACAFLFAAANFLYQRRRRLEERQAAKQALQRAYNELEARIAERTAELLAANDQLQEKVAALKETEQILRETQDNAVQAGKLAVLGQMAAGVTHELNQPLAALTTLSDNSVKLMSLERMEEVRENLRMMGQLAERMGRIVGQLKAFARKGPVALEPVAVGNAIANALLLVEPRQRECRVRIEMEQPDGPVHVLADSVRLEQVLVNLLRNAIEAMEGAADRRLAIRVTHRGGRVSIVVRDHGPGISEEVLPHLFAPFYTTKPAGKGLGLGLAISLAIVRGFGGELTAANAPDGGAEFTLELPET